MEETIRVSELAKQMGAKSQDLIKVLLGLGALVTINQSLDVETATLAASEFGFEVEKFGFSEDDYLIAAEQDKPEDLKARPPVVTIMRFIGPLQDVLDPARAGYRGAGLYRYRATESIIPQTGPDRRNSRFLTRTPGLFGTTSNSVSREKHHIFRPAHGHRTSTPA